MLQFIDLHLTDLRATLNNSIQPDSPPIGITCTSFYIIFFRKIYNRQFLMNFVFSFFVNITASL